MNDIEEFMQENNIDLCCKDKFRRYIYFDDGKYIQRIVEELLEEEFCDKCQYNIRNMYEKNYKKSIEICKEDSLYKDTFPFCKLCGEPYPYHYRYSCLDKQENRDDE
jgi:hypothetical protein